MAVRLNNISLTLFGIMRELGKGKVCTCMNRMCMNIFANTRV